MLILSVKLMETRTSAQGNARGSHNKKGVINCIETDKKLVLFFLRKFSLSLTRKPQSKDKQHRNQRLGIIISDANDPRQSTVYTARCELLSA